jgi:hypothetical protein
VTCVASDSSYKYVHGDETDAVENYVESGVWLRWKCQQGEFKRIYTKVLDLIFKIV